MENFSHIYNQLQFDPSDLSSPTDNSTSPLDENLILASSNPKKCAGRKKFRETRHPVFRGVRKRDSGKWVCEVRQPNSKARIWLGTYQTADMAARAHDVAALALRGKSACLNFADSTWRLPIPASGNVKDIQRAAAEAAEMFGPFQDSNVVFQDDLVIDESEMSSLPESVFYTDNDVFFGLPELIANMAEGLMLPPPNCARYEYEADDVEFTADMSLWNYFN